MRYFNYVLVCVALLLNQATYSQTLSAKIDELIDQQLPDATVGVLIKDLQSGEIVYSRNAQKLLIPASSTKLFTAAAALYYLKPDFHFVTTLLRKNKNYYLKFTGSPSLTEDNLTALLGSLKKNNINEIPGNLVIDTSQYQEPYYLSGDSYDDLGWAFAAPDTAAMLNENAEIYELVSAKTLGARAQIKPKLRSKSSLRALNIINEVTTVSKEEEKNHCSLHIAFKENNTVRLFGCTIQRKNPKILELAIPDPVLFVKQVTKKALSTHEILLKGDIVNGKTPDDAKIIAAYRSANLYQLITHMLQKSDNLYANTLTRTLGYLLNGKGTQKEGIFAIKNIIAEHTHVDMKQMEFLDGEGTRYNLIAPEHFVALLSEIYQDKTLQKVLLSALPQSGVSGTIQDRMKDSILDKKVFAKTGSMHDASSLSGFIINPQAKSFVFSIITNNVIKSNAKAKALEEKILIAVQEFYLNSSLQTS